MLNKINTRLYPACHIQAIQAINAWSQNVHINLHTEQKVDGEKGKMVEEQPCPTKNHYIKFFFLTIYFTINALFTVSTDLKRTRLV